MAHLPKSARSPHYPLITAEAGLVTIQVGRENRVVLSIGETRVLVQALRQQPGVELSDRLVQAIVAAQEHFREGRRHSVLSEL